LELVYDSAYVTDDNHTVITPKAFIEIVRLTLNK
jgi:hypothetical protein